MRFSDRRWRRGQGSGCRGNRALSGRRCTGNGDDDLISIGVGWSAVINVIGFGDGEFFRILKQILALQPFNGTGGRTASSEVLCFHDIRRAQPNAVRRRQSFFCRFACRGARRFGARQMLDLFHGERDALKARAAEMSIKRGGDSNSDDAESAEPGERPIGSIPATAFFVVSIRP